MEERPALAVELLFSKIPSTMFYLEHGYEKEVEKKIPRAAAELEMKPGMELEQQLGVVVSILINQGKSDALAWAKDVLSSTAQERKAWEEVNTSMRSNVESDLGPRASQTEDPIDHDDSEQTGTFSGA